MIVWSLLGCIAPVLSVPQAEQPDGLVDQCNSLWAAYTAFHYGVHCDEATGVEPVDPTYGCPTDMTVNDCAQLRYEAPQTPEYAGGDLHERIYVPACPDPDGACTDVELARCTDGTRPAVYLGRAPEGSPDARRWVIHFDGAGRPCGAEESCLGLYRFGPDNANAQALSSSHAGLDTWPDHQTRSGILTSGDINLFAGFNRVSFDRCVSPNQGASARIFDPVLESDDSPGQTVEIFYRSEPIFRSMLQSMLQEGFADAEQVILTGGSDGARGLVHMADRFADMVREVAPRARVQALFDSNFRPMLTGEAHHALETCGTGGDGSTIWSADYFNEAGLQVACDDPARRYPYSPANFSAAGPLGGPGVIHFEFETFRLLEDESCHAVHADHAEPGVYCRNVMHVLAHHVQTPFLVLGRLADIRSRSADWLVIRDENEPFFTVDETVARLRKQGVDLVEGWATEGEEAWPDGTEAPSVLLSQGEAHTFLLSGQFHVSRMTDCANADVFTVGEAVRRWADGDGSVVYIDGYRNIVTDAVDCL